MRTTLRERVKTALEKDNSIVVAASELGQTEGFSVAYLESLGVRKSDLKKLERHGLVRRGYTKNVWLPGDTLPSGKTVGEKEQYRGKGHRVRFVFVAELEANKYNHQIGTVSIVGKRESCVKFGYSSYRWFPNDILFGVFDRG